MKTLLSISFVLVSAAAVACTVPFADSGQSAGAAQSVGGGNALADRPNADGGTSSNAPVEAGRGGTGPWQIPACAEMSGPMHAFTSVADVEARVEGAWFQCSGGMYEPADAAGIYFAGADVAFLLRQGDTLVRAVTWDHERTARYHETSSSFGDYEIDLQIAPNGYSYVFPRVSEDGRFLELDEGTSLKQVRFVRAMPVGGAAPSPPVANASGDAASCADPLDPVHAYTSTSDVSARILGRWTICSGGLRSPSDTKGIEFTETQAYFLVDSADGLVPGPTVMHERDLAIGDASTGYDIELSANGGTERYVSRISESGGKLELDDQDGQPVVVYARVQ